jgi:hypothetical protein
MREPADSTPLDFSLPTQEEKKVVSISVSLNHPLLQLKRVLDWAQARICDAKVLAQSREECRWWTRIIISCFILCACFGVDVSKVFELASDGSVHRGIGCGAIVFGSGRGDEISAKRPQFDSESASRFGRRGLRASESSYSKRGSSFGIWQRSRFIHRTQQFKKPR